MWRGVALFCFAVLSASAQAVIDAESGPWTAPLDGTWRWHAGDNMAWAAPGFDDSDWPSLRVPGPLPEDERFWTRVHLRLGHTADPGLLLGPIAYSYDVYWDGRRIGQFGDLSLGQWFLPRWHTFHLPRDLSQAGDHFIAIRISESGDDLSTRAPGLAAGESRVGDVAALHDAESAYMRTDLRPRFLQLLVGFGFLLAGVYFLLLPPSVSQGAAFRWLGAILLGRALTLICMFYAADGPLNIPGNIILPLGWTFGATFFISLIEFPFALFRRRVPVAVRYLECFLATFAAPVPFPYSAFVFRYTALIIPSIVPIALAVAEVRKRTPGSKLNLVLFVLWGAVTLEGSLFVMLPAAYRNSVPLSVYIGEFQIFNWDAALLLWVPAIAMQVHKSNLRLHDEQQRLLGEIEAARHVQELLVPSQSVRVPGFEVDASYRPAAEIGGDFFQLFSAFHDALLVVVGDVSGKGMRAALVVSVIVGALQNRRSDAPAALLGELNEVLRGRSEGGFTTCCCALFAADGPLTIANAGHLAPYRNGIEMATLPSLPLGIDADARWTETHIDMQPGDRILWISDGVVEARNGERHLLGFQRAQELATRSASEIARAAQQFGQEDDITVVSVTRQPVPAYVA